MDLVERRHAVGPGVGVGGGGLTGGGEIGAQPRVGGRTGLVPGVLPDLFPVPPVRAYLTADGLADRSEFGPVGAAARLVPEVFGGFSARCDQECPDQDPELVEGARWVSDEPLTEVLQ
ncbi:hypothetical protein [Streptomyces sp. MS2.AVA.5]|uniref:Uncharacterized protein n=1 Tax=Streptomyces achmelvichensis TaxID=3134111 RepID=A0ACC6Q9F1_9ACTN